MWPWIDFYICLLENVNSLDAKEFYLTRSIYNTEPSLKAWSEF